MDNGTDIHCLVQEFVSVLRDSIRIFYDYRTVQEEFNKRNKNSIVRLTHLGNSNCNRLPNESRNPVLTLKRVITTFCFCGAEFANA
ncbi:unnamed protein product [Orchesella dallaii]|uniref:Uncharacterized protein n=1 Tax=Orchesella dallaii TaxID=48710 RepID=A0ABP1QNP0_9HEXA